MENASRSTTPERYEIRLEGHLDARWAARFDGLSFVHEPGGTTVIHGPVVDQTALHGLLRMVRDLGLPLISVVRLGLDQPEAPTRNLDRDQSTHERNPT